MRRVMIVGIIIFLIVPISRVNGEDWKDKNNNIQIKKVVKQEEVKQKRYCIKEIPLSENFQKYIYDTCNQYQVNYFEVIAVIDAESSFNSKATSSQDSHGLMQIHSVNHERLKKELGIKDFYNSRENVKAGIYMLHELYDKYKTPHLVYMAYNMGEGGARKAVSRGGNSSDYSRKVMRLKKQYEKMAE
jgi:soluble lytic murein transglycosylase-like protein